MKVVVTGGSGRLGQVLIKDLVEHGHKVLNLDKSAPPTRLCTTWIADLRESGQIYQAISAVNGVLEKPEVADAIIHLAAWPAPDLVPDTETFGNNVVLSYNVLEAAFQTGVKKVVMASSNGAFGLLRPTRDWYPSYIPIDEDHPTKPQDSYGLSKIVGERIADSFVQKSDMNIVSFRFPGFGGDYANFPKRWEHPEEGRKRLWTYMDVRDVATACRLGLETKLRGHEVFSVAAEGTHDYRPTNELIAKYLPMVKKVPKDREGNWGCNDNSKAQKMLGFKPKHRWEEAVSPPLAAKKKTKR